MTDSRSKVPFYTFPATLAEQEAALASHPMIERLAQARQALSGDRYRPTYHYVNPEGMQTTPMACVSGRDDGTCSTRGTRRRIRANTGDTRSATTSCIGAICRIAFIRTPKSVATLARRLWRKTG